MYFVPFVLLTLLTLLWIVGRKPKLNTEPDVKALLQYYQNQSALSEAERDYRLYHELHALRQQQHTQHQRLPIGVYGLLLMNVLFGAGLWYGLSGEHQEKWQAIGVVFDENLSRTQFLGEALPTQAINPLLLCQALQERIDRDQRQQLHILGQCYFQHQAYDHADSLYTQLARRYPEESAYRVYQLQAQLFKDPERPISTALETKFKRYIADYPEDTLIPVLLAAAYERAGRHAEAQSAWQQLAETLPESHPLYQQVQNRAFRFSLNAEITVSPELQSALPKEARLFLVLSRINQPTPPLAVKILPIATQQSALLSSDDLMLSQAYDREADYHLTAFISEDGSTSGKRHNASVHTLKLNDSSPKTLEIR